MSGEILIIDTLNNEEEKIITESNNGVSNTANTYEGSNL